MASAFLRSLVLVLCGGFLGARLALNPVAFVATLVISMVPFAALGLISAALVLVFKRADPFALTLDAASYLLCGVIYPVDVLPPVLQWASKLLPATYAISALRASGLRAATWLSSFRLVAHWRCSPFCAGPPRGARLGPASNGANRHAAAVVRGYIEPQRPSPKRGRLPL